MNKDILEQLKEDGRILIDPCPPTQSPLSTLIKVIGDILKKK